MTTTGKRAAIPALDTTIAQELYTALKGSKAIIEFDLKGKILDANNNFLELLGFSEAEVVGQHHSMLIEPAEAKSSEYKQLWASLAKGAVREGEYKYFTKGGEEIWLLASYNPILDTDGKPNRIIELVSDITEAKNNAAVASSTAAAIENSMAVIEFAPDSTILRANSIFLQAVGYEESEVVGKLHRMFVEKDEVLSANYKQFWLSLARGERQRGQFKRVTKSGDPVWLEASYNPILDAGGKLLRVVKFAYDITAQFNQAVALMSAKTAELEVALEEAQEAERVRLELDRTLQEMSTPVTPIWDEILLLPLVGIVDSTRTDDVMRKTLDRISQTSSKMFILDISGVPTVDTAVANQLIKITKATRIMGCETLVSGVSSSIAHTIVELGVDISELRTTATLRDAFSTCLSEMGVLDLQKGRASSRPLHRQRNYR